MADGNGDRSARREAAKGGESSRQTGNTRTVCRTSHVQTIATEVMADSAPGAANAGDGNQAPENAAELQFGPEFEDIHILSNGQVAVILQVSERSALNKDEELNDVYRKTQKYVDRFNTMTNPEKEHQELVDELDNLNS